MSKSSHRRSKADLYFPAELLAEHRRLVAAARAEQEESEASYLADTEEGEPIFYRGIDQPKLH